VRKAPPGTTRYKLYDSGGLFVSVEPDGTKLWPTRYTLGGKEKLLSFMFGSSWPRLSGAI